MGLIVLGKDGCGSILHVQVEYACCDMCITSSSHSRTKYFSRFDQSTVT